MEEARKYNVLPLDDRRIERFNSDLAGRPVLVHGNSQLMFGGSKRLTENVVLNLKNKSHSVTAEIDRAGRRRRGCDHRPGRRVRRLEPVPERREAEVLLQPVRDPPVLRRSDTAVPAGEHQVRMEFAYDGGGLAKGGDVALYLDGERCGEGRVEGTVPMIFSGDETCDLGSDTGSPVSDDYTSETSRFTGTVKWVQLDIAEAAEDLDHLITPEERLKVAMAKQ